MNSSFFPHDYNQGSLAYPYYAFWFIGKLSFILGIHDAAIAYSILGMLSALGLAIIPALVLKGILSKVERILISAISGLIVTFLDHIVIHKPHVLIAFEIGFVLLFKYFSRRSNFMISTSRSSAFDGILLGISFGCQPIFAIVVFLSLVFATFVQKTINKRNTLLVLICSSILALPVILPGLMQVFSAKDPAAFNADDYWFFSGLPVWFVFISFCLFGFLATSKFGIQSNSFNHYFVPALISGVLYSLICLLASVGMVFPIPPQRFAFFTGALIVLGFILQIDDYFQGRPLFLPKGSTTAFFVFLTVFSFSSVLVMTGAPDDLFNTFALSQARNLNLDLQRAAAYFDSKGDRTVLANGEYRFIQFYSRNNRIKLPLPFNQGWVSPDSNVKSSFFELEKVLSPGGEATLNDWLSAHKVNTILLQGRMGEVTDFPIESILYVNYPKFTFLQNEKVQIPSEELERLTTSGWHFVTASCSCTLLERDDLLHV